MMVSERFNLYLHWCRPRVKDPLWCIKSRECKMSQRTYSEIEVLLQVQRGKTVWFYSLQMTEHEIVRWAPSRIKHEMQ